jgi:hypothetical protein
MDDAQRFFDEKMSKYLLRREKKKRLIIIDHLEVY